MKKPRAFIDAWMARWEWYWRNLPHTVDENTIEVAGFFARGLLMQRAENIRHS